MPFTKKTRVRTPLGALQPRNAVGRDGEVLPSARVVSSVPALGGALSGTWVTELDGAGGRLRFAPSAEDSRASSEFDAPLIAFSPPSSAPSPASYRIREAPYYDTGLGRVRLAAPDDPTRKLFPEDAGVDVSAGGAMSDLRVTGTMLLSEDGLSASPARAPVFLATGEEPLTLSVKVEALDGRSAPFPAVPSSLEACRVFGAQAFANDTGRPLFNPNPPYHVGAATGIAVVARDMCKGKGGRRGEEATALTLRASGGGGGDAYHGPLREPIVPRHVLEGDSSTAFGISYTRRPSAAVRRQRKNAAVYAVAYGRRGHCDVIQGIFREWGGVDGVAAEVTGVPQAVYRGFFSSSLDNNKRAAGAWLSFGSVDAKVVGVVRVMCVDVDEVLLTCV